MLAEKHKRGDVARHKRAMKTKKWPTSDRGIGIFSRLFMSLLRMRDKGEMLFLLMFALFF